MYVGWFEWWCSQFQSGFFRSAVPFSGIAHFAGRDEIVPGTGTPSGSWHYVVEGEFLAIAAVLALESIPPENILPVEQYLFIGQINVPPETNYRRLRKGVGNGVEKRVRVFR
jgi:hypothetical protein